MPTADRAALENDWNDLLAGLGAAPASTFQDIVDRYSAWDDYFGAYTGNYRWAQRLSGKNVFSQYGRKVGPICLSLRWCW